MILGFVTTSLSFLAIAFIDNFAVLAVLFLIAGAGGSTYHPMGSPLLAEAFPSGRAKAFGLHVTGGVLGAVLGPIITGAAVTYFTWKPALVILAIPGLALAAILSLYLGPSKTKDISGASNIDGIEKQGSLGIYAMPLLFIAASFIFVLGQRGTDIFATEYFVSGRGLRLFEASLLLSSLSVAGLISAPICGTMADRFDRKKVLITLVIIQSAALFAVTLTPNQILAIPCIIFGFASFGTMGVGETILADITPPNRRSTLFGLNYTVSFSGSIILTPLLFATATVNNFNFGFTALSMIMPLSIILIAKAKTLKIIKEPCPSPKNY